MDIALYGDRGEFHGVVMGAEPRRGQQKSQNLWIGSGGPLRHEIEQQKHEQAARQASKQIECACTYAHGEEEKPPFRAEDGERTGERAVNQIDPSSIGSHGRSSEQRVGLQPGKSQERKLTAAMAMPTPNRTPARTLFDPPSPKANVSPATTMATRARPRAIVLVKAC